MSQAVEKMYPVLVEYRKMTQAPTLNHPDMVGAASNQV